MAALISKPGITRHSSGGAVPLQWSQNWFRDFISDHLKGADVRNAIGKGGISITGTISTPYATIQLGGSSSTLPIIFYQQDGVTPGMRIQFPAGPSISSFVSEPWTGGAGAVAGTAIDIGNVSMMSYPGGAGNGNDNLYIIQGASYDGSNYRGKTVGPYGLFVLNAGNLYFYTAPTSTVGGVVTFSNRLQATPVGNWTFQSADSGQLYTGLFAAGSGVTTALYLQCANGNPWAIQLNRVDLGATVSIFNSGNGAGVAKLFINSSTQVVFNSGNTSVLQLDSDHASGVGIRFNDTNGSPQSYDIGTGVGTGAAILSFYDRTHNVQIMQMDNGQRIQINGTSASPTGTTHRVAMTAVGVGTEYGLVINLSSGVTLNTTHYVTFGEAGTQAGAITAGATATSVLYSTGSDYRLKTNVQTLPDGMPIINQLRPVSFNWIADNVADVGFLAHELQAVVPQAVTGVKDAVNEDGSIAPQGVDLSKLVPWIVAALQHHQAQITNYQTQITALQSQVTALTPAAPAPTA